jgi:hypothetical protein
MFRVVYRFENEQLLEMQNLSSMLGPQCLGGAGEERRLVTLNALYANSGSYGTTEALLKPDTRRA